MLAEWTVAVHDGCCREAARAASLGNSRQAATALARAALSACKTDGCYVSQPTFTAADMIYQDYGGQPQPDQAPTVTLVTHCKIRLPVCDSLCGAFFVTTDGFIHASCRYVFPLTKLQMPVPPPKG